MHEYGSKHSRPGKGNNLNALDCLSKTSPENYLKVSCSELLPGMYIAELDRDWKNTPFTIGGFLAKSLSQIEDIQRFCKFVYIDTSLGVTPIRYRINRQTILSRARESAPPTATFLVNHDTYKIEKPVKKEVDAVYGLYAALLTDFAELVQEIEANDVPDLTALGKTVSRCIASIIRNPNGFVWYLNADPSRYQGFVHSIRAALWSCVCARQLGHSKEEMKTLFLGVLLADIGFVTYPQGFIDKRGLIKKTDYLAYRNHITISVDLIKAKLPVDKRVLEIVRHHHERHDGRGFPNQLKGSQIPLAARIASMAYCFERMLNSGPDNKRISPAAAVSRLYKQRRLKFDDLLVYEFIQTLGMYPTGSVVELSSGEIAIVVEQNPQDKFLPGVVIVTNKKKKILNWPWLLDLGGQHDDKSKRSIVKSLEPGTHNVDPKSFSENLFGKKFNIGSFRFRFGLR